MKMPKKVDLSKSINREKVIEPSIANNEKNIECPPLAITHIPSSQLYNRTERNLSSLRFKMKYRIDINW
jgi:hypothetical protein